MINIRLFCNAGMSTSILVKKMKESALQKNLEVDIVAYPLSEMNARLKEADIVLLGPQVGYEAKRVKGLCAPLNIPSAVIPMSDYGMMNGEKILMFALQLQGEN